MCGKDLEELRDHTVTRDEPKLASDVVFFLWISLWYLAYFEDYCFFSHQPDISSAISQIYPQPSARYILRCRN